MRPIIIDLSHCLENDTPADPPGRGPKIEYLDHKQSLPDMLPMFPGLRQRMERGAGISMPRAVVLTLTFTAVGVPGVTLTVVGTVHVAAWGAPVQVSDTVCVVPVAVSWSAKLAACPAVTVALVDPPCGGAIEKPSPVPVKLTV